MPNTSDDPVFKAFSNFSTDDMPSQAGVSRRMLRQLEDVDKSTTPGPDPLGCARGVGVQRRRHAVVELETQLIELKKQLPQAK